MNIILIENPRFPIGSFLEKIYEKYPRGSILYVNDRNFEESSKTIKTKPLLTRHWCLILSCRLDSRQFSQIINRDNLNIIHLPNNNKLEDIKEIFMDLNIDAKILNNLKIDADIVIDYINDSLNISYNDARYIYNRHHGHVPTIINSISILSTFNNINRTIIKNYTTQFGTASFYDLLDYLLGLETRVSKSKIIALIYSYRYGFSSILNFLVKELEKFLLVYDYVSRGLLDLNNYLDFEPDLGDRLYKKIGEYQLKKILNAYKILSYEKLYYIYLQVKRIKPNQNNIYKLIKLIGG